MNPSSERTVELTHHGKEIGPKGEIFQPDLNSLPAEPAGVRIYTRDPITLPWLQRVMVPVIREMQAEGSPQVWFRRGWLHGPHVDLVAQDAPGQPRSWPELAQRLHLPPADPERALTPQGYLAQAREFGRLEAIAGPYLPFADHGAIRYLTAADLRPTKDPVSALPERQAVLAALCFPILDTIDQLAQEPRQGSVRLVEAFIALADSYFLGLAHGSFSYRSHAEAFFAWSAPSADVRPQFAQRLAQEAEHLRPIIEQRLAGEVSPLAAKWRVAFGYASGALDAAVARGALTTEMVDAVMAAVDATGMGPSPAPEQSAPSGTMPDTDFHRTVAAAGRLENPPPWFAAYRVLINLFYQQLPLLTVSPLQRYYTCYAVAELVDEVLGETWQQRLQRAQVGRVNPAERS